jgi:hypothetical protein
MQLRYVKLLFAMKAPVHHLSPWLGQDVGADLFGKILESHGNPFSVAA